MTIVATRDTTEIDPWGAHPGAASRIAGLGGKGVAPDPGYVFRTDPTAIAQGEANFSLAILGLVATRGTLLVELFAVPANGGDLARAMRLKSVAVSLAELVRHDGCLVLHVDCWPDLLYGVAAYLNDETDARASNLTISVHVQPGESRHATSDIDGGEGETGGHLPGAHGDKRRSARVEPVGIARLTNLDMPSFGQPMSQYMTRAQLRHPDYLRWAQRLNAAPDDDGTWCQAFVMQALQCYGMLAEGSRCLGLDLAADDPLPAIFADMDYDVVVALHEEPAGESLVPASTAERARRPSGSSDVSYGDRVAVRRIALGNPDGIEPGFDFAWSTSLQHAAHFRETVYSGLKLLKQGGIGVHVVLARQGEGSDLLAVSRAELERIAVDAISYGHDVVQMRFRRPAADAVPSLVPRPFGLIVRRG